MFDGRWRSTFEKGLRPIGAHIKRTGVTANHLTTTGLVMAMAASLSIAQGWLRAGLLLLVLTAVPDVLDGAVAKASRSEEHTSELQSRQYLVCRLLLEKKKK